MREGVQTVRGMGEIVRKEDVEGSFKEGEIGNGAIAFRLGFIRVGKRMAHICEEGMHI